MRAIVRPVAVQVLTLTAIQMGVLWLLLADDPQRVRLAALATLPLLLGILVDTYAKAIVQGQERYKAFNLLRMNVVLVYLVGVVALIATGHDGVAEFTAAFVVANLLCGAMSLTVALAGRAPRSGPDPTVSWRSMARFGLKGHLAALSPVGAFRLDQAVIGVFLAPRALGLYVTALAFTFLPEIISRGVGMVALPRVAGAAPGHRRTVARDLFAVALVLNAVTVVALEILAGFLVPFLFGSEFEDAVLLVRVLLVGAFFWGARRVLTDLANGVGRPGLGSIAEVVSWIVLVPAMAVLGALWGVSGIAAAMSVAAIASFAAILFPLTRAARWSQPDTPGGAALPEADG